MTKHPLTDKKAFKKFWDHTVDVEMECLYTPDGIRAAADWQLEQVMKWLGKNLSNYTDDTYLGDMSPMHMLDDDLKEAMRPTKGEQLQDEAVNKFMKKHSAALTKLADS